MYCFNFSSSSFHNIELQIFFFSHFPNEYQTISYLLCLLLNLDNICIMRPTYTSTQPQYIYQQYLSTQKMPPSPFAAPPAPPIIPFNYKYLMISFLVIKYTWQQYINLRQLRRNLIKDMPQELTKYRISTNQFILSQSYSFDKITFQMLALSIRMAVDVLSIACNLLPFIWDNVGELLPFVSEESQFQRAVGYTLIQAFKSKAFQVPILAYQTFVIEKKYNFTNKTIELFIYDIFVEGVLMLIIFPPIIYGYLEIVEMGGEYFYVFLQIFVICLTIVLTWIHPNLIAPLFNKFTQLKDEDIKAKISLIAKKNKIKLQKIYVVNSSVRSAHSNAYLYGLGNTKVIVLHDSLLNSLTKEEVLSVVVHEMGHSSYSHSLKKLLVYLIQVLSMFYIFAQFVKNQSVFISFGFSTRSVFICTALYFYMFQPLTTVFNTFLLMITRKFQFQADTFACDQGCGENLKNSLIKLFKQSTSTVRPDILYAWIKHSHPSIYERIQNINQGIFKNTKKYDDAQRERKKIKTNLGGPDGWTGEVRESRGEAGRQGGIGGGMGQEGGNVEGEGGSEDSYYSDSSISISSNSSFSSYFHECNFSQH